MSVQPFRATTFLGRDHLDPPRTCGLGFIRTALGVGGEHGYGDKRMVTYVTQLVEHYGFPKPLPALRRGAVTEQVTASSKWLRDAVDAWLEDRLPPDAAASLDAAAHSAAAADMDDAARNLGSLGGRKLKLVGGREA